MRNRYRHFLFATVATDVGQRLRPALEICVVLTIIMLLITLATRNFEIQTARAELSEAFALISRAKVDLIADRAESGRWPAKYEASGNSTLAPIGSGGRYVSQIGISDDGAIDVTMGNEGIAEKLAGRRITFRFGISDGYEGAPIILACGSYPPPPGMTLSGRDRTTIDPEYLPSICKEL